MCQVKGPGRSPVQLGQSEYDWESPGMKLGGEVETRLYGTNQPLREFCLYPDSHAKLSEGFTHDHLRILTIFSLQASSLMAVSWMSWVVSPSPLSKPPLCLLLPLKPGCAAGTLLPFWVFSLKFWLHGPLALINRKWSQPSCPLRFFHQPGDFVAHLCLLVLDRFSQGILDSTSVALSQPRPQSCYRM